MLYICANFHEIILHGTFRATYQLWGGRVVRWCWVNFQCRGVLLVWITIGQGPTALTVGAGGGLDIFTLIYPFSPLSPSLWETARYRLKYCLKGPLNPKQPTNQPTYQLSLLEGYGRNLCRTFIRHDCHRRKSAGEGRWSTSSLHFCISLLD